MLPTVISREIEAGIKSLLRRIGSRKSGHWDVTEG